MRQIPVRRREERGTDHGDLRWVIGCDLQTDLPDGLGRQYGEERVLSPVLCGRQILGASKQEVGNINILHRSWDDLLSNQIIRVVGSVWIQGHGDVLQLVVVDDTVENAVEGDDLIGVPVGRREGERIRGQTRRTDSDFADVVGGHG